MKREKNKRNWNTLTEIFSEEDMGDCLEELQRLAKEDGTSVKRMVRIQTGHYASKAYFTFSNEITESEIIHNIQEIPKTETMIDTFKSSVRNYKVDLAATIISLLTMLASWALVFVMLWSSE